MISAVQQDADRSNVRREAFPPWGRIWAFILLASTLTGIIAMQERNDDPIIGRWKLDWVHSGFFPKQDLLFEKTEAELTDYIFQFNADGTIAYRHTIEECPVGVLTVKDGYWKYVNGLLRLELRGLKIADCWYWWTVDYRVEFREGKMHLQVDTIIKNRQIPSLKSWEELIRG